MESGTVASIEDLLQQCEENPQNVKFDDLRRICEHYFGRPRRSGSHCIYKTPWIGDPRINLQNDRGKAKAYQVKQVIKAVKKFRGV